MVVVAGGGAGLRLPTHNLNIPLVPKEQHPAFLPELPDVGRVGDRWASHQTSKNGSDHHTDT